MGQRNMFWAIIAFFYLKEKFGLFDPCGHGMLSLECTEHRVPHQMGPSFRPTQHTGFSRASETTA